MYLSMYSVKIENSPFSLYIDTDIENTKHSQKN